MTPNKTKFQNILLALSLLALGLSASFQASANEALNTQLLKDVLKQDQDNKEKLHKKASKSSGLSIEKLSSPFASWGIDPQNKKSSINLQQVWKKFEKKKDIVVAVIDTGIDPEHPFLKDNIYVPKGQFSVKNYGLDFSKDHNNKRRPFDSHGHGTHVAGIVKSVFPEVKLMTLKYYNPNASGQDNLNSTIGALRYAVNNDVDIINYSGGGPEPALEELRILKLAEKKGILIVAAAGNEKSDIDDKSNAYYPASYGLSNIITVTAHDKNLKTLSSSNYGAKSVDVSAPGNRIKSSLPKSRAGFLTGTSQATAFVSGVAALIKSQFPKLTTDHIKDLIVRSAKKEISMINKTISGGRLDALKAHQYATQISKQINGKSRELATSP